MKIIKLLVSALLVMSCYGCYSTTTTRYVTTQDDIYTEYYDDVVMANNIDVD